jgi:hypothetical protein
LSPSLAYTSSGCNRNMVLLTLIVVVLFLIVLYYYVKRIYFTLRGPIPGIPPQFILGNLLQTGAIGSNVAFNIIFLDLKSKFGDIFQYWLGPTRVIVVSRLEMFTIYLVIDIFMIKEIYLPTRSVLLIHMQLFV